jgi:peptidoglycan/xylan/chitin deacetylase (PgdA/CDA1 family)
MTIALCFHHVSPTGGVHSNTPQQFRDHLQALRRRGFAFVDFDTFARARTQGRSLGRRTVLVTTDDGYVDNWYWAYPVLRDMGVPAVFFVISSFVGSGDVRGAPTDQGAIAALADDANQFRFVRWNELQQMQSHGLVSVQSHTHTHVDARRICSEPGGEARLRSELLRSREVITQHLGRPPRALAWPWGSSSAAARRLAADCGLDLQFSVTPGRMATWSSSQTMGRICADNRDSRWLLRQAGIAAAPLFGELYTAARRSWTSTKQALAR